MSTSRPRRVGVFTIASKNYLAYARVLLGSVRAFHPEYSTYLCLCDTVDGQFDPAAEDFTVLHSDRIGLPHFADMALRYDIMEFNTAVKPFVFEWLLNHTDLDAVIYLDPDIRLFSRLDRLEDVLAAGASMVLTPHIIRPLEDGKNPNDHHMLQTGVFNLGFAAASRCDEARRFLQWWGRRTAAEACDDIPRNLFTDQRWCDLAPCFVERLHILRDPGYNVAYWNLAERSIARAGGDWSSNGEPLVFFHFSGLAFDQPDVLSRHQNRFSVADLPTCRPLLDAYRNELIQAGWHESRQWGYAYDAVGEGLRVPRIVRRFYRECFPQPQDFGSTDPARMLLDLCNGPTTDVPRLPPGAAISRLMHFIHRQSTDLQAAFDLRLWRGRRAYRAWFESAGARDYQLPRDYLPLVLRSRVAPGSPGGPRALAVSEVTPVAAPVVPAAGFSPPVSQRIAALARPAPLPWPPGRNGVVTVGMHLAWQADVELQRAFDLERAAHGAAFVAWYGVAGKAGEPAVHGAASGNARPGVNLVGYAHAEMGMGEHVRMAAAALAETPVPFGVVDFNVGVTARQQASLDHGHLLGGNTHAANLFMINADQMFVAYRRLGHGFFADRYNIGYWSWELAVCPPEMRVAKRLVDELWAPSRFIQEALQGIADVPVEYMPLCVALPEVPPWQRSAFDLPEKDFIFLYTFDCRSYMERKNPCAAVRAFQRAFPGRQGGVTLVLKAMHGDGESPGWRELLHLVDNDPRIRIINRTMDRGETIGLVSVSDCYVSLHRSEGFGRGPAEAMLMGKPVIATNYSGSTDFTRAGNSCLVDFSLVAVEAGQYPHYAGQVWAEPDVEQAARYMRELAADDLLCADLGARARAFMQEHFSPRVIGQLYESRLRKLGLA